MKLIVNADDFGISKGVNLGIIHGYKKGIITSTTMLVNMEDTDNAVEFAKKNPNLGVGIHLALTIGRPVRNDVLSLVDCDGKFNKYDKFLELADEEDIRKEFRAQMDKFLSYGLMPTHIDSHHHVHAFEKVFKIVKEIAEEYDIPLRKLNEIDSKLYGKVRSTTSFIDNFFDIPAILPESLKRILKNNSNIDSLELMCHPGYLDWRIICTSSYKEQRARELETLTDANIIKFIEENNIELIKFTDLV